MSRHSPTGFVFSLVVEIAAVVAIVSFLPRIDLRPTATAAAASNVQAVLGQPAKAEPAVSPVGWTTPDGRDLVRPAAETSYYQRRGPQSFSTEPPAPSPQREPPPLIVADPSTPGYVEQQLDRASQQLVNSVGTAVVQAAGDMMSYPQPAPSSRPSFPTQDVSLIPSPPQLTFTSPPPAATRRPAAASTPTQPRPWIRY
jgi:hypothetical protein